MQILAHVIYISWSRVLTCDLIATYTTTYLDGDKEFRQLEEKLEQARLNDDGNQEALIINHIDAISGYSLPARASELLHGLGFLQEQLGNAVKEFSGGWFQV